MSDPDEERRARDLMIEASALLRRVRKGDLHQRALELLGALDHPAALEALGSQAPPAEPDLKRWVKTLDGFGPQVSSRIIVACARELLPVLERDGIAYLQARAAVEVGEGWLACPCEAHAKQAQKAHTTAIEAGVRAKTDKAETAVLVAAFAALVATMPTPATDIAADAADVLGEEHVRRTIQLCLAPWALSMPGEPPPTEG